MPIQYTYWQSPDGLYLGYMNEYPDNWTQGRTLNELELMLSSLLRDIQSDPSLALVHRSQGVLH